MATKLVSGPQEIRESVWDDNSTSNEAPLIQRLTLALDFGVGISHPQAILDFAFHNVLDVISPTSVTLWRYDANEGWHMLSAVGQELQLPAEFLSWDEINQTSVLLRRPSVNKLKDAQSKGAIKSHWVIPVILPGRSCYVLHILAESNLHHDQVLESFLQSFAYLVVNCDLIEENHDSSSVEVDHKILDAPLTDRQEEILQFLALDLTYDQIATRMGFSQSTIKQEAMKIFKKLGVSRRADAVKKFSSRDQALTIHERSLNG